MRQRETEQQRKETEAHKGLKQTNLKAGKLLILKRKLNFSENEGLRE